MINLYHHAKFTSVDLNLHTPVSVVSLDTKIESGDHISMLIFRQASRLTRIGSKFTFIEGPRHTPVYSKESMHRRIGKGALYHKKKESL